METAYIFIALFIVIVILYYIVLIGQNQSYENNSYSISTYQVKLMNPGKCNVSGCSSIDPVSDPKYNMQQIVKQSILLEEHLANKNKRCRDCITKHFLHIIGLAEEAQMLATNKIEKYPLINECVELYNSLFKKWLQRYDLDVANSSLICCDELRTMRKRLIAVYFFDDVESND